MVWLSVKTIMFDSYSLWCSCSYCLWQIYYQYEEGHRNLLKRNASSKECWSNTWTIRSEPHGRLVNKPVCLMVQETGFVWHLYYNNIQDLYEDNSYKRCVSQAFKIQIQIIQLVPRIMKFVCLKNSCGWRRLLITVTYDTQTYAWSALSSKKIKRMKN